MDICESCSHIRRKEYNFCPNCGIDFEPRVTCSYCRSDISSASIYCSNCGKPQGNSIKPTSSLQVVETPEKGITIEFKQSTSSSFDLALIEARKLDSYRQIGSGKKTIYRVNVGASDISMLHPLVELIELWRNKGVYIDGKKHKWDEVFRYVWCFEKKTTSYKPKFYCYGYEDQYNVNVWGCLHTGLAAFKSSKLYTYGKWLNNDCDWQFDKDRIKHELERSLHEYRFCPAMDHALIIETLGVFPDIVNPKTNDSWEFIESYDAHTGLKITSNDRGYEEIRYMTGAAPKDTSIFINNLSARVKLKLKQGK